MKQPRPTTPIPHYEHVVTDVNALVRLMADGAFGLVVIDAATRRRFNEDTGLRRTPGTLDWTPVALVDDDVTDAAIADGLLYVDAEPAFGGKVATLTPRGEARAKAGAK